MNFLSFFLILNLKIGINFNFQKDLPSEFIIYEKEEIFNFFKGYNLSESEFSQKNVFEVFKEKFDFFLKIDFEEYESIENYLKIKVKLSVFDIERKRVYERIFERSSYIEEDFHNFFDFLNYSIFSFLSQIFPPILEVKEIDKNFVILSNSYFPEIFKFGYIKIFDEYGKPVGYLKIVDVKEDKIYSKKLYLKKKIKEGFKGIVEYSPSNESGILSSLSLIHLKGYIGKYGEEKNLKNFDEFKYGFNFGFYYKWVSLSNLNFDISFYPSNYFNLWEFGLGFSKGFNFKKILIFIGDEIGAFIASQKAKNEINVNSISFKISPYLKFEIPLFEKFSIIPSLSYPFSQSLNSFWYEKRGGTEYVSDSLLIYKEIKIKGPNLKIGLNYKLNTFDF